MPGDANYLRIKLASAAPSHETSHETCRREFLAEFLWLPWNTAECQDLAFSLREKGGGEKPPNDIISANSTDVVMV